ncbi:hypothetical protein QTP70_019514, partial [Hemibagrus guttatus]
GQGTSLLGRDWFEALGISVEAVHRVQVQSIEEILTEYSEVFQDIGACQMPPISIDIDSTVTPRFFKACQFLLLYGHSLLKSWLNRWLKEFLNLCGTQSDHVYSGIPGVQPYLDDILISGKTMEEHNARLRAVLKCFTEAGLRLKKEKSIFAVTQVEFLGFCVDKNGIKPTCEKVKAIQNAPSPWNKTEHQAFLGLLNFYSCFLPNKATVLEPLHRLLDQSSTWQWGKKHEEAYVQAKQLLQTNKVLAHYDEKKPLAVVCDASPYELGALLFHMQPDGQEKPICFASRTMTTTERNYAQIDKEALAVVFEVRKFHQHLAGRHFVIFTDHMPLLGPCQTNACNPFTMNAAV